MNQINNYARVLGRGKSFQCEKWSPLHTYQNNPLEQDFVVHNGSLWVCLENCVAGEEEPGINNKWAEVCSGVKYEDLTPEQIDNLVKNAIRFDKSQNLSENQKNQARENINASDDSKVVHNTKDEIIQGHKTFDGDVSFNSTVLFNDNPNMNNCTINNLGDPILDNQATTKSYVDTKYNALETRIAELENIISQIKQTE